MKLFNQPHTHNIHIIFQHIIKLFNQPHTHNTHIIFQHIIKLFNQPHTHNTHIIFRHIIKLFNQPHTHNIHIIFRHIIKLFNQPHTHNTHIIFQHIIKLFNQPHTHNIHIIFQHIFGEVYNVDDKMKNRLDHLENVGVFYDYLYMELETDEKEIITCFAYVLNDFHEHLLKLTMLENYNDSEGRYVTETDTRRSTKKESIIKLVKRT